MVGWLARLWRVVARAPRVLIHTRLVHVEVLLHLEDRWNNTIKAQRIRVCCSVAPTCVLSSVQLGMVPVANRTAFPSCKEPTVLVLYWYECLFGSFGLWELTCMLCVYPALWTRKVLCGSFYAPHIHFHSFVRSSLMQKPQYCCVTVVGRCSLKQDGEEKKEKKTDERMAK